MQELLAISELSHGQFGQYKVSGAKYSGGEIVGWGISLQINPHEPSAEYWVSGREIREAIVGAMPNSITPGAVVTGTAAEQEAIFAAIDEWERRLSLGK